MKIEIKPKTVLPIAFNGYMEKYIYILFSCNLQRDNSSIIRQKGESQNGGNKKAKHAIFSGERKFLTPSHRYQMVRNIRLSENLALFS